MNKGGLAQELFNIIDSSLANELLNSFKEMEQRFAIGDLKPTGLEGGRFCEAVARSLYQIDAGKFSPNKSVSTIVEYLIDENQSRNHVLDAKDRKHVGKVLSTAYKFRSDRGAIHISTKYTANELDATFVIGCIRWLFSEFLRLSWNSDRNTLAEIVSSIVEIKFPVIHMHEGEPLVLNAEITCDEEILLILFTAPGGSLEKRAIHNFVQKSASSIRNSLGRLKRKRFVREKDNVEILTPLGRKFVLENLARKLVLE